MRRLVKNTLLFLQLALLGSRADATSIRETIPLPIASDKTSVVQNFGHAKEGTNESYTQGGYSKAIHQFAPSPLVPFRVSVPSCYDVFSLHLYLQQTLFRSSFYYSSFCNKAPPIA
jgi:hypothetical protein